MFKKRYQLLEGEPGAGAGGTGAPAAGTTPPAAGTGAPAGGTKPPEGGTKPPENGTDWRKAYAGEDTKKLNMLSRYTTPNDAFDALISVKHAINSGELRSALPKNATPEQVAKWRADNGIPEAVDGYKGTLAALGVDAADEAAKTYDSLFAKAHEKGIHPSAVQEVIKWHMDTEAEWAEKQSEQDQQLMQQTEDKLRAEWGTDYRMNMNLMQGILDTVPEAVRNEITTGRLGNGQPLLSSPEVQKWLVHMARQINPVSTLVPPNSAGNMGQAIDDEIGKIEKTMRENRKAYNEDGAMQKRYLELLEARDRIKT